MKNILIIGGSSGVGKVLANLLVERDYRVFATYFKGKPESETNKIEYAYLDATSNTIDLDFLPDEIHGVVYCPGSINLKPFNRMSPDSFEADFRLQVSGAIRVIQEVLPMLKAAGNGSIVLFSTVAVKIGFNFHTQVATSKGAIEGLTKALATEFAPSIRVNAIAPSLTDTPLAAKILSSDEKKKINAERHPLKRIGTPTDIAEMAAFLLSDRSSWMTGQILHVDGGMSSIR